MEMLQRITSRLPSFVVVDMPKDNSSLFNVDKEKLMQLGNNKDQGILLEFGGVDGIILSLKTSASYGIRGDAVDLRNRINFFESNSYRSIGVIYRDLLAMLRSFKDFSFLFLCACSMYLIVVGIMLYGWNYGWSDGLSSFIFSFFLSVITSTIERVLDYFFYKAIKGSQLVIVLRNGLKQQIPVSSIQVGDIALLKEGDKVPADGLLLEAYGDRSLKLDESHLTDDGKIVEINDSDPFLSTGAKVVEGQAKMMVTHTVKGKNFGCSYEITDLGAQMNCLIRLLKIMRWALALSSFVISLCHYFSGTEKDDDGKRLFDPGTTSALEVSYMMVEYIVGAGAVFVAMDTTNFYWALRICFAHAINAMAGCNVIVRNLSSWEKIVLSGAIVNVIDEYNASKQLITSNFLFVPQITENKKASSQISSDVLQLIQQGIGLNTTGISNHAQRKCKSKFSGSPSERAFLSQAALESDMDWGKLINDCAIIKVEILENQGRLILVKKDDSFLEHRRGPAEMTLAICSHYYDDKGNLHSLDEQTKSLLEQKLRSMDSDSRNQVIALAYRQVPDQELEEDSHLEEKKNCCSLLGFVVLKEEVNQDEILQDVVQKCRNTGMEFNIIFHEENLDSGVAGAAATETGETETNNCLVNEMLASETTIKEDDITQCVGGDGSEETSENCTELATSQKNFGSEEPYGVFQEVEQNHQEEDFDNGADTIELGQTRMNQVSDDGILAQGTLAGEVDIIQSEEESKESKEDTECPEEVVFVSGSDDGVVLEQIHGATNLATLEEEVTALSEAIVSISLCIEGDKTTRTSNIVILDGKCTTLPLILMWANQMLLNTQAFTQFQLTMMISNILTEIISVAGKQKTSGVNNTLIYQLIQEIWVNTVMGLIAVITFGRQRPQPSISLLQKPPEEEKNSQIVTGYLWRNIITQSAYQIIVVSVLQFKRTTFGFTNIIAGTTIFVLPIFLQVLNMVSARKIEEKNIFSGIPLGFIWLIPALMIAPFVLVDILATVVGLERLDVKQWAICIAIALVSWPVGFAAKLVPVGFFTAPVRLVAATIKAVVDRLKEVGNWIKSTASKLVFW